MNAKPDDVNLDDLLGDRPSGRVVPEGTLDSNPSPVSQNSLNRETVTVRHDLADPSISLSSDATPDDYVELSLDLTQWDEVPVPHVPRFQPLKVSLFLNLDVVPILASDGAQADIAEQLHQYAERLNGFRLLQQAISQTIMHRAALSLRHMKDKRLYRSKVAHLKAAIAAARDEHKKAMYPNDTAREAELAIRINNDGELRALDERIFEDELSITGFSARLEALQQEARPLERELEAARDTLNFMVNTGMVAASYMSNPGGDEESSS